MIGKELVDKRIITLGGEKKITVVTVETPIKAYDTPYYPKYKGIKSIDSRFFFPDLVSCHNNSQNQVIDLTTLIKGKDSVLSKEVYWRTTIYNTYGTIATLKHGQIPKSSFENMRPEASRAWQIQAIKTHRKALENLMILYRIGEKIPQAFFE